MTEESEKLKNFILDRYIEIVTQAGFKYRGVCLKVTTGFIELEDTKEDNSSVRSIIFQSNIDAILLKSEDIEKEEILDD